MYRHVVKSAFWLAILTFSNLGHSKRVTADARIPKQFIIEIEKGQNVDHVSSRLKSRRGLKILKTFDSDVFSGFSVETEEDNVDTLKTISDVSRAWASRWIALDPTEPIMMTMDVSASNYSQHKWTGVQELHDQGILGKGAKVAIVDTGIDYNHPALGGGFGAGFKVSGGYDLVGDGSWPTNGDRQPDDDPIDMRGHGTHVAGIIAGNSEWFKGVAPEAELMIYKVFSTKGNTNIDVLIEAFTMAYEAGADVITASIGGSDGFSDNPWALVASRIVEKGVIVTISAGNDGKNGPFYASSGSSGRSVLAVASAKSSTYPADPFEVTFTSSNGTTTTRQLGYLPGTNPWDGAEWPIWAFSFNTSSTNDGCGKVPDNLPDLTDYIVLMRRGGCELTEKEGLIRDATNATHFLVYNDEEITEPPFSWLSDLHLALIDGDAGEAIIRVLKDGGNATANFSKHENYKVGMYNSFGGRPSPYTSWGGLVDLDIKPDVTAPGGEVFSTYIDGGWAILSGTSMSCPYVAGVAALYVGKVGGRAKNGAGFARQFVDRIISSGAAIPWQVVEPESGVPPPTAFWAPVAQVGSGMINASKAFDLDTTLSFDKFVLNDTAHFADTHSVEITNSGKDSIEYTFTVQPFAGFDAKSSHNLGLVPLEEMQPVPYVPDIEYPLDGVKLDPGEKGIVDFTFKLLEDVNETALPIYSGKVLIHGSNGDELSIPYMGAAFDLKEQFRDMWEGSTPTTQGGNITEKSSWTFSTKHNHNDFPRVIAAFRWGCYHLRWDIYKEGWQESQWQFPPVVGENGYVGAATSYAEATASGAFDPARDDAQDLVPFPMHLIPRNSPLAYQYATYWWMGQLANGSMINPGNYTWRFASLRPFGNPEESMDWDIWETPTVEVLPLAQD